MHCGWLRCHVVWFDMVVWGELEDDLVIRTTQIYSVLHSTTPVLLCTTKYYSSTNSVLQSTTPVPLCTTTYYSSTTLYYTVLLQYYSSTTLYYKVLLQYYSVLQSTTLYYKVLLQYYSVLLQYYAVLQSTTPVLFCTTKYYSSTTDQMLCLPRKVTLMIDPRHI